MRRLACLELSEAGGLTATRQGQLSDGSCLSFFLWSLAKPVY